MVKVNLTTQFIKGIEPPSYKPYETYTDNGLILRVTTKGKKSFYYQYKINRQSHFYYLGQFPVTTLKQAREKIIKCQSDLMLGKNPKNENTKSRFCIKLVQQLSPEQLDELLEWLQNKLQLPSTTDNDLSLDKAWDIYTEYYQSQNLKQVTIKNNDYAFKKIPSEIRKMYVNQITCKDISQYVHSISNAPSKANQIAIILRTCFKWLHSNDYIKQNVLSDFKNITKPKPKRQRPLSNRELRAILNVCTDLGYPYGNCIFMLICLGQRKNEVTKIKWQELDLENGILTLTPDRQKTGGKTQINHIVPLPDIILNILKGIKQQGEYVFSTKQGIKPIANNDYVKKKFDTMLQKIKYWKNEPNATLYIKDLIHGNPDKNIQSWIIHDFRDTFITNNRNHSKTVSEYNLVGRITNHKQSKSQTDAYDHNNPYDKDRYIIPALVLLNKYANWLHDLQHGKIDTDSNDLNLKQYRENQNV